LGFWNIRDFSDKNRSESELLQIAQVAHGMDCMAICELNDTVVLGKLVNALASLGGPWAWIQTKNKVGNSVSSSEHYGFVFRSDKLKVRGTPHLLKERKYSWPPSSPKKRFDRDPFVSSFETLDGRMDFTMIVVHVTWGTGIAARKGEIRTLKTYFNQVQNADSEDDDVILCGDFNRNVNDPDSLTELLKIPAMIDSTDAATPTKIDTENTYDHLLFQTTRLKEYKGTHGVIKFDEDIFGNNDAQAALACSDHRPVWVKVIVPDADDD
jgi:endonuclease/exonuclease/phosphatase family metal-dependent hydrolase